MSIGHVQRPLTLLIVDREELALWGFSFVLSRQGWVHRCLVASDPATARVKLQQHVIDAVVVDTRFGPPAVKTLVADVHDVSPFIRVILMTPGNDDDADAPDLPRLRRTWSAGRLVAAVRAAALGDPPPKEHWTAPGVRLSAREREVLSLVSRGSTNAQIGLRLRLSPHTVKQHTSSAYRKLEARNRAEAVTRARELGLIQ